MFQIMRFRVLAIGFALLVVLCSGCRVKSSLPEKNTAGDGYDVVVLCDDALWQGELSYCVCDVLEAPAPGLTRTQGYFNIVKQVSPSAASNIDRMYPNLLAITLNPTVEEPSYTVSHNVYARPQTVVVVTAPDKISAVEYLTAAAEDIRLEMEVGERRRDVNFNSARPADELMADFKSHMGLEMVIPAHFFKANTADKELLWYIRDYPNKAQYIFAFTMPYDTTLPADLQPLQALSAIDAKLGTISSKDAAGSYMRISNEPQSMYITPGVEINGREWLEIRGWWDVAGDFMGGPFVGYVTTDATTSEAKVVLFALYAPEDPQRNLLRELEHLIYTAK